MKISKNSWHYKANVKMSSQWKTERKNTLCSYFWHTVGNVIVKPAISAIVACLMAAVVIGTLFVMLSPVLQYFFTFDPEVVEAANVTWSILGMMVAFIATVSGFVLLVQKLKKKGPGLLGAYLKARKDKVCPLIQFEDK